MYFTPTGMLRNMVVILVLLNHSSLSGWAQPNGNSLVKKDGRTPSHANSLHNPSTDAIALLVGS